MLRLSVVAACAASAAAFAPLAQPTLRSSNVPMSMSMDRRQALQTAAAAALALPLAANAACDNAGIKCTTDQINKNAAPIITVFDHRGCVEHANKEYAGPKSGDANDEMALKIQSVTLKRDDPKYMDMAKRVRDESVSVLHKSWQKGWLYDSDLNAGITNVHGNEKAARGNGLF